jgi:6-phosphogluconate dehydrogenase (decarboxylating)
MDIGIVGLGRMGGDRARRLARGGVRVVGYDGIEYGMMQAFAEGFAPMRQSFGGHDAARFDDDDR